VHPVTGFHVESVHSIELRLRIAFPAEVDLNATEQKPKLQFQAHGQVDHA
jgi:hypothetical protein